MKIATVVRFHRILGCVLAVLLCMTASVVHAREIKVGHAYSNTHPMHLALIKFADEVKAKSNGDLTFSILHSGVLGGDAELIQQMLGGMIEASYIGGINAFQGYVPQAAVEDLPFMFKDNASAHKAIDGPFGTRIAEKYLEPLGFKHVMWIENGFRQITNNKRPIVKPEDLKGLKLRVPPLEMRIRVFKLFGANPVPMSLPELFTALQQNTVDGQENPIATIESFKFNEVQKYLSIVNHTYISGFLAIHNTVWKSLTPVQQKIILDAGIIARDYSRELYTKYEDEAIERIRKSGVQINDADYAAFAALVKPVWDEFAAKHGSDLIDLLEKSTK